MAYRIEPFDKRIHERSPFQCGEPALDRYLQQQASQDLKRKLAAVFVIFEPPHAVVLGYYTLSAFSIEVSELESSIANKLPSYPRLPATLLGRLAVDASQQGRGLGELLLLDALYKALKATSQVGSLAIVAEAICPKAIAFYQKYGFQTFQREPMKLYLPMKSIQKLDVET